MPQSCSLQNTREPCSLSSQPDEACKADAANLSWCKLWSGVVRRAPSGSVVERGHCIWPLSHSTNVSGSALSQACAPERVVGVGGQRENRPPHPSQWREAHARCWQLAGARLCGHLGLTSCPSAGSSASL